MKAPPATVQRAVSGEDLSAAEAPPAEAGGASLTARDAEEEAVTAKERAQREEVRAEFAAWRDATSRGPGLLAMLWGMLSCSTALLRQARRPAAPSRSRQCTFAPQRADPPAVLLARPG